MWAGSVLVPISSAITTEAGGTATYTAVLTSQPVAPVTITFAVSDATEGSLSLASVTFTLANWNEEAQVSKLENLLFSIS